MIIPSNEFAAYVSAYTDGMITPTSTIRIVLAEEQPVIDQNVEVNEKLFGFSPSLKGKTYWIDNKTIEFVPDAGALKPGALYHASFSLSKVISLKDHKLDEFKFSFRVAEQSFALRVNPVDINGKEKGNVFVSGDLHFYNIFPTAEDVAKMLTVKCGNKTFVADVIETDDALHYTFMLTDITRSDADAELEVTASGKAIGIDRSERATTVIPALKPFKLLVSEIVEEPSRGVMLTFSDPVSDAKDLSGLVSLRGEDIQYVTLVQNNKIGLYFENAERLESVQVGIDQGLKNIYGETLDRSSSITLDIRSLDPQVEFLSSGSIMPSSGSLILPFRTVSLYAVDLRIMRIYESNALMFLQDNALSATNVNHLRRSGRLIYKKMLRLDTGSGDIRSWTNHSIDMSKLIEQEPGAIYRVELSFIRDYAASPCDDVERPSTLKNTNLLTKTGSGELTEEDEATWDTPETYYYDFGNYNWDKYDWYERDNPCHDTYYMMQERRATKNVLASDLGIIVKANSNNKLWLAVSDLVSANPVQGAELKAYNFQLQPIGTATTDGEGFAIIETRQKPFVVVASKGKQKTYLRVADGENNFLSRFDIGGKEIAKGLKGYVYGERGVWRPGDTLHVAFMMEDRESRIPDTHPVTLEMYNPRGQFYFKQVSTHGINGLYTFDIPTVADDPTGLWNAYVKVGGATFHKSLRIETIKPNRLKINLDIPGEKLLASKRAVPVKIHSAWLTGAVAHDLNARVEMILTRAATTFKNYDDYSFENPTADFSYSTTQVFDGQLDGNGDAKFDLQLTGNMNAPGMLRATLSCNVFEPGGSSIHSQTVSYSPFDSYVGIRFNLKPNTYYFETDVENVFDVVTVDAEGKPVNRQNLEYKIYNIGWNWWWNHSEESFVSYANNTSITTEASGTLATVNGKGAIKFKVEHPGWGRYLIYVKDRDGGHATGGVIYVDWPSWRGRSRKSDPNGITMLAFSTDKPSYEVGEDAIVTIPAASGGRALVAIENGSDVISREWITTTGEGDAKYVFKITKEMTPNVYLHISLLQPHEQTTNDLPIRMYGVVPVFVTDKNSLLEPQITMDEVLRPETEFTVKVKEAKGMPMTYTLAIVDDGLLDLTNFKTPDPWNEFYAREALGIRTWDMYDWVMGAFGGKYGSLFSVGGDFGGDAPNAKANRFKPVVKFIGPIVLKAGEASTHKLKLPPYIGSVRVMVVAGQNGAYGNAEKTVPVRTPLMILSTLPRVVSANEEIALPVNVFAMEASVKNVSVKVETGGGLMQLVDAGNKSVSFDTPGDRMVYFRLKTGASTGVEKITVTATGNGHTSKETIEIDVRNPNPTIVRSDNRLVEAGQSAEFDYRIDGYNAGDWVKMDVSRIPSIDISRRLDFLVEYPHYCSEQLSSSALPMLFLEDFKTLTDKETAMVKINVRSAIANLYGRQVTNGGIAYWPGQSYEDPWITSYAGSFLLLAKEKGYEVNTGVLTRWKDYQRKQAQSFRMTDADRRYSYYQHDLEQAYRLYTLALAGAPEMGAMNRLKEMKDLSLQARWRLAAAYALAGKNDAANELVFNSSTEVDEYSANNASYGSPYRDEAMILETLILMGRDKDAFEYARKVANHLSHEPDCSTQTAAYALIAMGRLAQKIAGSLDFSWTLNGTNQPSVKSTKALFQTDIPNKPASGSVAVKNTSSGALYVNVVSKTKPLVDSLPPVNDGIKLEVTYLNLNGEPIDVSRLQQGVGLIAEIRIANESAGSCTNMALTHIIPSGWEINARLIRPDGGDGDFGASTYTYQDIRDDRVLTYFDLNYGQVKVFRVQLMASYAGSFVLPAVQCEAMYEPDIQARTQAGRVVVAER